MGVNHPLTSGPVFMPSPSAPDENLSLGLENTSEPEPQADRSTSPYSPAEFVQLLNERGADDIEHVRFKDNRHTIVSLGRDRETLHIHQCFREATDEVVDAVATFVSAALSGQSIPAQSQRIIQSWNQERKGTRKSRKRHQAEDRTPRTRRRRQRTRPTPSKGCHTPEQQAYLETLYAYLNQRHFDGRLPEDVHLRLSDQMSTRLGHMRPWKDPETGEREVVEVALNVDLMLEENDERRREVLLHEMCHAAAWLFQGHQYHGKTWKLWAHRVGIEARACSQQQIETRASDPETVRRVPPLPNDHRQIR